MTSFRNIILMAFSRAREWGRRTRLGRAMLTTLKLVRVPSLSVHRNQKAAARNHTEGNAGPVQAGKRTTQ